MKWMSSSDRLPADQQEVLVKTRGQVHLAKYQAGDSQFVLRNGIAVKYEKEHVEWMELVAPPGKP